MSAKRGIAFARLRTVLATLCALLLVSSWTSAARAQANDAAAAQALFNEGKRLMAAGQYAEACPKFAESQRLDPGIGTMLWLADCHAKNGRNASAWALFAEAEALAAKHGDKRVAIAREEAKKLEPKLSKLVIDVSEVSGVPGLEIKRDGVALGRPLWGGPIPTDPGAHRIVASAPDKKSWEGDVDVPRDGGSVTIRIPALADAPPTPPTAKVDTTPAPPPVDATRGRTQRTFGIALVGLGVAGAAVGSYFGLQVGSKKDESDAHCSGNVCDRTGFDLRKDALSAATISDVAFIAAGAALVGGAVLYLTAPKPMKASVGAAPLPSGGGAAMFQATF